MKTRNLGIIVAVLASTGALAGCTTESFCWNCDDQDAAAPDTGAGGYAGSGYGGSGGGICVADCGAAGFMLDGAAGSTSDACVQTNNGIELCDGLDNNCDGKIDEIFDLAKDPGNCGVCALINPDADCRVKIKNAKTALCSATPGAVGKCDYDECVEDYFDLDGDRTNGCEYYCVKKGDTDGTCDNIDDNCDGKFDEGINKCAAADNCGKCGRNCARPNATGKCVAIGSPATCDDTNTQCEVECADGWIDANNPNKPAADLDGCEYQCTPTNGGVEICDGMDNDCDGKIDALDPDLANDAQLGKPCNLAAVGECAEPAHTGIFRCVAAAVKCVDDNSGSTDCTADPNVCGGATPYCIDSPTPGKKVCGTKVIKVGDLAETCNLKDDDCDGTVDGVTSDSGGWCGSNAGICSQGKKICTSGQLVCSGQVDPQPEMCNGADDDCDGVTDGVAATPIVNCNDDGDCSGQATAKTCLQRLGFNDKVCASPALDMLDVNNQPLACDIPQPPPAGWTSVCQAGILTCVGGAKICAGSTKAQANLDQCNKDMNCDGIKSPDFDVNTDPKNCGGCGNDCSVSMGGHVNWTCVGGACTAPAVNKCEVGYIDCDSEPNDCEKACAFYSNKELCNGVDDNCDCHIDEMYDANTAPNGITQPSPAQVCGVIAASGPCIDDTKVVCSAGTWSCQYPAGYCTGASCAATQDLCDGIDNNCNGNVDENYRQPVLNQGYIGQSCASDDKESVKHGLCRQTGRYECDPADNSKTACVTGSIKPYTPIMGVKLPCGTGAGQSGYPCEEACDGQDNDCDGVADEPRRDEKGNDARGSNATYFVKPAIVQINTSLWVFQYEASRPNATDVEPGSGNGWWTPTASLGPDQPAPPAGVTLDKTPACSVPSKVPWFNVSGLEAQHVCKEMGGRLCKNSEWQGACKSSTSNCYWGFNSACQTYVNTTSNPCNLGPHDFDPNLGGNQDGLLPTGSMANCRSNFSSGGIFDITGNLRELTCGGTANCTATQSSFILMGGAFNTNDPKGDGAKCDFTFYNVDQNFKLYDVGFRCCFDQNPTL